MTLTVIESPFAGRGWWPINKLRERRNVQYARAALRDSLMRGECPIASHLLYTQPGVLRDDMMTERARGIEAGLLWARHAELVAVYTDLGITDGMRLGLARHEREGRPVEYRTVFGWGRGV